MCNKFLISFLCFFCYFQIKLLKMSAKLIFSIQICFLMCSLFHNLTVSAQEVKKQYHLGAFVRLQGHPNFDVSLSEFDKMMNDPDVHSFSFKSFLKSSSFGKLDYEFVYVKRTNSDTIPYYYDTMPQGYYAAFSSSNPNGFTTDTEKNERVWKLTERYIKFLNDNLSADVKLDGDGDGKVDIISYIAPTLSSPFEIESYSGNWAGGIPHNNRSSLRIKGLGIDKFSVTIADAWKNVQANGIFKHEVGHNLKTWDVYDNNNNSEQRFRYRNLFGDPVNAWNMMTGASNTYGAYIIWSRLGFLSNDDVKVLHKNGTYRLNSLFSSTPENVAFRINSPNSATEYFMLEYRSRHKTFEWWHNDEGLVVSLVNSCVRGNARGNNNPRPFELFYLRDSENNVLFKNISLNQQSNPKLALSDGIKAGFSLNNIRIENGQLVFDLVFDDEPYINAVEYPELVTKDAQTIEWQIETNSSNATLWDAVSNVSWLTLTKDYANGILRLQTTQNYIFSQRNATITLSAPGAVTKKAYLVQRGTSSASAFWMPEVDEKNTVFITGEENSHNIRVIGDLDGSWWGGDSNITNGRGERQVLHNSINSVYAYRNSTTTNRSATISFRLKDSNQKSFTVTQRPATIAVPTYTTNNGTLPDVDDGKWYYIRTERATCTFSNFLRPIKNSDKWIIGTGLMAYNDSLLWTIERNGAGAVILRNKAMGYIDLNNLAGSNISFSKNKLSNSLILKKNVSSSYFYGVAGYAFEGNASTVKGLHVLTNGNVVNDYFNIDDNCTFFFEQPNAYFLKYQGNMMLNALKGYESFTESHEIENLRLRVQEIDDSQLNEIFVANAIVVMDAINIVYNTLLLKLTSTPDKKVENWFVLKRHLSGTWGLTLNEQTDQYLFIPNQYNYLEQEPLKVSDNRFSFKFERQTNGKFHLINKSLPTLKLSSVGSNIRTLSYSPISFDIRPVITFRGLKFALINDLTKHYIKYNENQRVLSLAGQPGLSSLVKTKSYLFDIQPLSVISSVVNLSDNGSLNSTYLKPYVKNGKVIYPIADVVVDVYNLHGIKVKNDNLANGIYVVRVLGMGFKVIVR